MHSTALKRRQDRRIILAWFAEHTGTPYECSLSLGMLFTTALPRCSELKKDGCLMKIPQVPQKDTGLGGTSASLIITQAGKKELRA